MVEIEKWQVESEIDKKVIATFLYNLNKDYFEKGLANITIENNILTFRKIKKEI